MKLGRREFVIGAMAAAASGGSSMIAAQSRKTPTDLLVFDSRLPASAENLSSLSDQIRARYDIATFEDRHWVEFAGMDLGGVTSVVGCTTWGDFVVMRDLLRSRRMKLTLREQRLDLPGGDSLFLWRMA